jgi:glutamate formiminotransferase
MKQIVECIPNFSEGRDLLKIEEIVGSFRGKQGVKLLDYSNDEDHNRLVVTVVGEPEAMIAALTEAVGKAIQLIDLNCHEGQHPRMGAVDVIPFVPIKDITMEACIELSKQLAETLYQKYQLPSFLYEKSASAPHREDLAKLRKGQFEGMAEKVKDAMWQPDFGVTIHPTAGITAIGARMPLVAFNVNLNTNDLSIADKIAKSVRHISGGLRYCKALGIELKDRNLVQVSMNMTDYTKTPLYRVFELIRIEANRYGVSIVGSEIIGLVPMDALINTASYYMGLEDVEVLEKRFME